MEGDTRQRSAMDKRIIDSFQVKSQVASMISYVPMLLAIGVMRPTANNKSIQKGNMSMPNVQLVAWWNVLVILLTHDYLIVPIFVTSLIIPCHLCYISTIPLSASLDPPLISVIYLGFTGTHLPITNTLTLILNLVRDRSTLVV